MEDLIKIRIKKKILPELKDADLIDECLDILNGRPMTGEVSNKEIEALRERLPRNLAFSLHPENLKISFKMLELIDAMES